MNVECLTTWEELVGLREAWNVLAADVPFLRWDWLGTWWKHYGTSAPRSQLFVLAVYEDVAVTTGQNPNGLSPDAHGPPDQASSARKLVGIAPWMIQKSAAVGTSIEFLGEEEVCTDHVTVLTSPSYREPIAEAIAEYLSTVFRDWDVLNFFGVDDADPAIRSLFSSLQNLGFDPPHSQHVYNCWKIALPPDWDAYYRRLSKSHRRQMRRAFRRIDETGALEVRNTETLEALRCDWSTLVELHQKRWASRSEPGCFASARFDAFHREVVPLLLASGHLRLSITELDGIAIAAEYNLGGDSTTYAYQSGIDPEQIELEPGRLSMVAAIRNAIDNNCTWHDFLRGDEPYKPHWRATPFPAWHYRLVNCRATARFRDTGWRAAARAKELVKAGFGRKTTVTAPPTGRAL